MEELRSDEIRSAVRENYGEVAQLTIAGRCCCSGSSCCGTPVDVSAADISKALGYSDADVTGVPEGANMGLGCGNPQVTSQSRLLFNGFTDKQAGSGS